MKERRQAILVTSTLDGIGPGRVMVNLGVELAPHGYDATIVSTHGTKRSELIDEAERAGLRVAHLDMQSLWDPRGPIRLFRLAKQLDAAIVHSRTIRADVVSRATAAAGAIVINNVVNLYPDDSITWHGPRKGRLVLSITRATRKPVDMFVANAHALVPSIRTVLGASEDRVRVIHDGIRLDPWESAEPADLSPEGILDHHLVCLTAARLHPQKGLDTLISAAVKVTAEHPDARFVIAGDGPSRAELEAQINSLGLEEKVRILGWREDIAQLLARSRLFILPSRFEGLPNAVIEAMAAGVPTVATAVAGTPEIIDHARTGWLVRPGDVVELADTIVHALGQDLESVGAAARTRAREHFSLKRMGDSFAALYAELLEERQERATSTT